jgi:hypothetical protein
VDNATRPSWPRRHHPFERIIPQLKRTAPERNADYNSSFTPRKFSGKKLAAAGGAVYLGRVRKTSGELLNINSGPRAGRDQIKWQELPPIKHWRGI